jgi:hypothetical protein
MKTWIVAAAVAALSLTVVSETPAQVDVSRVSAPAPAGGTAGYGSLSPIWPYSYYAAWPGPARGYVPYGPSDQFAFYGQPYGHAYDRWTWAYMGGGYNRSLARYYYPPIP